MEQVVEFKISMSVDATKTKAETQEFLNEMIAVFEDYRKGYSYFKVVSIKEKEIEIEKPDNSAKIKELMAIIESAEEATKNTKAELRALLSNDFRVVSRQIRWHYSGKKEWKPFGVGQYIEGINDEEDEDVFYWVGSEDEIEVDCDLGDFKIVK
jgi:hypothetical protein